MFEQQQQKCANNKKTKEKQSFSAKNVQNGSNSMVMEWHSRHIFLPFNLNHYINTILKLKQIFLFQLYHYKLHVGTMTRCSQKRNQVTLSSFQIQWRCKEFSSPLSCIKCPLCQWICLYLVLRLDIFLIQHTQGLPKRMYFPGMKIDPKTFLQCLHAVFFLILSMRFHFMRYFANSIIFRVSHIGCCIVYLLKLTFKNGHWKKNPHIFNTELKLQVKLSM